MKDYKNPYEVLKLLILDPSEFQKLSDKIKNDSFFILNRILGQQFPEISNSFNVNGIYPTTCLDFYAELFKRKRFSRLPSWVYSKFASKHGDKKKTLDKDFIKHLKNLDYTNEEILFLEDYDVVFLKKMKKEYDEINTNT